MSSHNTQNPAESRRNPTDLTLLQNAKADLTKIIKLAGELQSEIHETGNCNAAYSGLARLSRYALDADEALLNLRSSMLEAEQ